MRSVLPLLLGALVIGGCAPVTPYRTDLKAEGRLCTVQGDPLTCRQDALFLTQPTDEETGDPSGDPIPVGVIEFDDQGALQNRPYKDEIMARIRKWSRQQGTLVVVFAHGWLNNAAPDNGNLANFQKMLARIAEGDRGVCVKGRTCHGRKVVGVFLAWRGMSATVDPFKTLSFWNRKSRAHRVGQDGATEVLTELAKIKAGTTKVPGRKKGKKKSRLILIGHSFGGALIYSATQQLLMQDASFVPCEGCSVHRNAADLVILVNPAFEAARFTALHEKAASMRFPVTQSPILAIFTSVTDFDTKRYFSVGRRFSSLFTKYNPGRTDQATLDRTAIGHHAGYLTHHLRLRDENVAVTSPNGSVCSWERFRKGETHGWDLDRVVLDRKSLVMNQNQQTNPYHNVAVDDAIISGHTGIWEPDTFMEFIYRFVMVQKARACAE